MDAEKEYQNWNNHLKGTKFLEQFCEIKDNQKTELFGKFLNFGTAGLRAIMGLGNNRMNIFTVGRVSQGFADYLCSKISNPKIAISYDTRINSKKFAETAARVMAANGVSVYLTKDYSPTPFLSFAVRSLNCDAGIMITASHNSKEYNGYKCYGSDGAQIEENQSAEIYSFIEKVRIFEDVKSMELQEGLEDGVIEYIDDEVYEKYLACVLDQKINNVDFSNLKVLYTPLNGCGINLCTEALKRAGVVGLKTVPKQMVPDGNFESCPKPNPEVEDAFKLALRIADKSLPDLIIATDPDADRLGICVLNNGRYTLLSGNQIGILLFYYIVKNKPIFSKDKRVLIKTLVSTKMASSIAEKENCEVLEVFTGFKNIAKEIHNLESTSSLERYIFGFEESNGYLCAPYVRDKDAISASILAVEAAAYFKSQGLTLCEVLEKLSEEYGYYLEKSLSFEFKGSGMDSKISKIMAYFRSLKDEQFGDFKILNMKDYLILDSKMGQTQNMVRFDLGNQNEVLVRPSGTEPKLKVYIMLHGETKELLHLKLEIISEDIKKKIEALDC